MKQHKLFTVKTGIGAVIALLMLTCFLLTWQKQVEARTAMEQPQVLPTSKVQLGEHQLNLWLARFANEKALGLMFFEKLDDNQGMLFIYNSPQMMSFWMKNTKIELDLVFFNENLRINGWIKGMQPGYGLADRQLKHYRSKLPAQYALELKAGSIERLALKLGDRLEIPITLLYSD